MIIESGIQIFIIINFIGCDIFCLKSLCYILVMAYFRYYMLTYQQFCTPKEKKGCNYLSYFDIPNIILDYPNPLYLNVVIF